MEMKIWSRMYWKSRRLWSKWRKACAVCQRERNRKEWRLCVSVPLQGFPMVVKKSDLNWSRCAPAGRRLDCGKQDGIEESVHKKVAYSKHKWDPWVSGSHVCFPCYCRKDQRPCKYAFSRSCAVLTKWQFSLFHQEAKSFLTNWLHSIRKPRRGSLKTGVPQQGKRKEFSHEMCFVESCTFYHL